MLGLLGLGRRFELGPLLGFDALGLGERGLGHGAVLRFEHGRLGLALARLADLVGLGLLAPAARPATRRSSAWAMFSPSMALAFGVGHRDAHLAARRP